MLGNKWQLYCYWPTKPVNKTRYSRLPRCSSRESPTTGRLSISRRPRANAGFVERRRKKILSIFFFVSSLTIFSAYFLREKQKKKLSFNGRSLSVSSWSDEREHPWRQPWRVSSCRSMCLWSVGRGSRSRSLYLLPETGSVKRCTSTQRSKKK